MPAVVAIIGRPNVGKSTLFNSIVGKRVAIESPISGTTRDPVTSLYKGEKVDMLLVDTGGLEFGEEEGKIEEDVQAQARIAIMDADIIVFCVDTKALFTAGDEAVVSTLRKSVGNKPVIVVGTKYDGTHATDVADLFALGIGDEEPMCVSAIHNAGVWQLMNKIEDVLSSRGFTKDEEQDEQEVSIAVLGRPNVGKSSLINALSRSEKLIVSDVAGTTRDAVDMEIVRGGKKFRLIDTAGIRRRSKIDEQLEKYAIMRSLASLRRADVTLLLLDAKEGIAHQDKYILEQILEAETGIVVVVNKWDLSEKGEEAQKNFLHYLTRHLSFIPWAPVLFVSAKSGKNIEKILELGENIDEERKKRISTGELNAFLQEVQQLHPIAGVRNTRPKIKYGTQVNVCPPHFVFNGSRLEAMHFSSRRYLENRMRDAFGFMGTPLRLEMNTQKNPYHEERKIRLPAEARKEMRKKRREEK